MVSKQPRTCGQLLTMRWIALGAVVLTAFALSTSTFAGEAESATPSLPDLPPKLRDNYEIDRMKREIELKQLQIQFEQLQGPQDSDLERRIKQAADLEQLLVAKKRIHELLVDSPEYAPLVEQILGVDPTPPACACLDEVWVHWIGADSDPGRAELSFRGTRHTEVGVGGSIGGTACQLQAVTADTATVSCQGREQTLGLTSQLDSGARQ